MLLGHRELVLGANLPLKTSQGALGNEQVQNNNTDDDSIFMSLGEIPLSKSTTNHQFCVFVSLIF